MQPTPRVLSDLFVNCFCSVAESGAGGVIHSSYYSMKALSAWSREPGQPVQRVFPARGRAEY